MYLDSCVFVKLFLPEPESEAYHDLVLDEPVLTSELAVAEVRAAFLAKERMRAITARQRQASWQLFQSKIRSQEFVLLPLNRQVVERAGAVIEQCHPRVPLRTLDALHVATAELHGGEAMCSSDLRVRDASNLIGLSLIFPSPQL